MIIFNVELKKKKQHKQPSLTEDKGAFPPFKEKECEWNLFNMPFIDLETQWRGK